MDPPFDWRTFTLAFNTNNDRVFCAHPSPPQIQPGYLSLTQIRIDWSGSGTTWDPWIPNGSITATHTFPEPANGVSEDHDIAIEFYFSGILWDSVNNVWVNYSTSRVVHGTLTVLPQVRVYADGEGNAIVQFRNEDCAPNTPLLIVGHRPH